MAAALAPLSQTVILTEDGIPIEPKVQVTIPPFVPSLLTVFEDGTKLATLRPNDIPGFADRVREIDAILNAKGRYAP